MRMQEEQFEEKASLLKRRSFYLTEAFPAVSGQLKSIVERLRAARL
jgi:hypothetical protein